MGYDEPVNKQQEKELRRDFALIRTFLVDGLEPHVMRGRLGCGIAEFEKLLEGFYEAEADDVRERSTERTYADYVLAQSRNVKDLTDLLEELTGEEKTGSARVSAIKARADIYDRIITKGQEFGFVKRKPQEKIIAGVMLERLTNDDLRCAITGELQELGNLMTRFGGGKSITDVQPGQIHRSPTKTKALPPSGVTPKRARNPVHGGRRVVKGSPS